jgi:hypothetical protein
MAHFGHKPLTWQQVLSVVLVLAALIFAILAYGGNIEPQLRPLGRIGLWSSVAAIVLLLGWHNRRSKRPDLMPDVLAAVFSPDAVLQLGDVHIAVASQQHGPWLVLRLFLQNLRDGLGFLELRMQPRGTGVLPTGDGGASLLQHGVPTLSCDVPGGAVVEVAVVLPLRPPAAPTSITLFLSGKFHGAGRRVRFGRRGAVTERVKPGMTLALLAVGHLHAGGGTYVTLPVAPTRDLPPFDPALPPEAGEWRRTTVWSPENPASPDDVAAYLRRPLELFDAPATP